MAETIGNVLAQEFNLNPAKVKAFNSAFDRFVSGLVNDAGDRIMENVHKSLFYEPTESEVAMHKFIMAAPIKKTSLKNFSAFRKTA